MTATQSRRVEAGALSRHGRAESREQLILPSIPDARGRDGRYLCVWSGAGLEQRGR